MGLDMYLYRKTYVGNQYVNEDQRVKLILPKDNRRYIHINEEKIVGISEEVGYWRKANAIHNWFVQNVQKGADDCGEYYVSGDNLKALKAACEHDLTLLESLKKEYDQEYPEYYIFKDVNLENLQIQPISGFFFGGTEIDRWYKEALEYTLEIINKAIEYCNCNYYYSSSW